MPHRHAAVWLDHQEAKVFHVVAESVDETTVRAPHSHVHRHSESTATKDHPADAAHFHEHIVEALAGAEEILLVGPGEAKNELMKYIKAHHAALAPKVLGVETVDHPSDGQIVKHLRKFFVAADKMH